MTVVFDILSSGFQGWPPLVEFGFASILAACFVLYLRVKYEKSSAQRRVGTIIGIIVCFSSFGWGLLLGGISYEDYVDLVRAYRNGHYTIVEGTISNFRAAPGGHGMDSFDVAGRNFGYWVASNSSAFHNSDGELARLAGTKVRVFSVGGEIVRIESLNGDES